MTTEYVTEYGNGGGLGNYLSRLARLLCDAGHFPEVFVLSSRDETVEHAGVRVQRVSRRVGDRIWGRARRMLERIGLRSRIALEALPTVHGAWALAAAVRRREQEAPFDLIQSADYQAAGLYVQRKRARPHVVRCSLAADLWSEADGVGRQHRWVHRLERFAIRRADYAYAPSQFVADYFRSRYQMDVGVLRPPVAQEIAGSTHAPAGLPVRFFLHFGQIIPRKGSDVVAQALPYVWEQEPDFRMVWAGRANEAWIEWWRGHWGARRDQVAWLGPLEKQHLYAVLERAEASVLPSLVDNLPNTVIESLLLDKPVIGSRGASIDEIVRDGANGVLVPVGDARELAHAMVRLWRRQFRFESPLLPQSPIYDDLKPENSLRNLLALCHRVRR